MELRYLNQTIVAGYWDFREEKEIKLRNAKKKHLLIFLETFFLDKQITINIAYEDYVPKDDLATVSHAFCPAK